MLDIKTATGGAQKIPSEAFLSIWLSKVSSATARLSRLVSVSNSFRSQAWSTPRPPYSARQREKVCSETQMRRAASTTVLPEAMITSAYLSLLIISSAVYFLFGISRPLYCPGS